MPTLVIQSSTGTLPQSGTSGLSCQSLYSSQSSTSSSRYFVPPPAFSDHYLSKHQQPFLEKSKAFGCWKEEQEDSDWTTKYVPITYLVKGKSFKQQVDLLLKSDEIATLKNTLFEFVSRRSVDSLLFHLYPLFNGIGKGREILWHYVLHCLTHHEKSHLKKRLYDLTHTYLADFSEAANPTISSNSQNMKEQTSTSTTDSIVCCTPPNGCENQQSPGRRSRRRQAARSSIVLENSEEGPSSSVTLPYNDAASSNNENAICPLTRRYRRRKTVGNIHFTDEEHAAANEDYARHIESLRHPASKSIASSKISASTISEQERAFYDDEKQAERRRRRELSKTSRRRRVVGAEPPFEPFTEAGQSFSSECRPLSCGPLATFQPLNENNETAVSEGAVLRRNRRRSNRQTIETSKTTMNGFRGNLITNLQQSLTFPGDKKKKSKSDTSSTKRQEVSTLPTSSIDDAVSEQQTAPNHRGRESKISSHSTQSSIKQHQEELDSTAETKQQLNEVNDQAVINGKANSNQSNHEDSLFKSDRQNLSSGLSPQFNAIFLEDSKQKKNYLNALKKKLTFSRPPKNNDTDTFLCELSAQFDEEMNLVDDIEIVEENKNDFKFGEKWSYLPKSRSLEFEEAKDDFPTVESILNEVKDFEIMQESKASQFNETGCKISLDKTLNTVSVCNIIDDIDDREVPPFPVDLGEVENESPSYPPPSPAPIVNILPPVVRYSPPTVNPTPPPEVAPVEKSETSNRTERVRRRRRRNAENAARKNEETTHNDFAPKNDSEAIRRISDPLPALQSPQQDHAFEDDKVIYDVPKPVVATQRRAHVNIEKRTRRSRANRPTSMVSKRNSTEVRMHVWTDNDLSNNNNNNESGKVKMRSSSPVEQTTFFERAKKKNYRVSGISMAMEDIFSEAEEDLHENEFSPPPPTSPPAPAELTASQGDACDPDEVYAPLHEEVLALGLAYDENEQKEEEVYQTPQSSVGVNTVPDPSKIPPPPPLPPPVPPPPPPVPLSPPLMFKNNPPNSPVRISVKRINWEKLEPANLDNTVWGQLGEDFEQINDAVKYLDLEEHFAMKNAKALKMKNKEVKKDVISIMAHKKAYNTSILLAHLKLSHREICDCLLITGTEATRKKMDSSHYKQLLMYAPDHEEVEKFNQFKGDVSKLNEADLLALKLVKIPGYQLRLKALVFKHSFAEKEEEIQRNLSVIQKASFQLRKSRKLAKILEFVLAMGNYMNRGHVRISKATGFRIHFLAEMDSTKTSDNKLTFLHILARAVISKFPDVVTFVDEIPDVKHAARIIYPAVSEDLQQLRKVWLDVRDNLHETASKNKQDRFKIAMETCLVRTNGAIKRLEQLHNATVKEFNKVAQYFGENPKNVGMQQFFKIFEEFTRKFEKSHNEIKKFVKTKPSSTPKR